MTELRIHRSREVRAREASARRLSRAAAAGILARIRRGAYVDKASWLAASSGERHRLRLVALHETMRDSGRDPVFSHESAALLLGMPIIGEWPELPHLTVPRGGGKSSVVARRTERSLPDELLLRRDGFLLTGPLRTAVDLAATRTVLGGAVTISDARHRLAVSSESILAEITRCRPFRSVRRVERALALSSDLSESVLETLTLVRIADLGFEPPEQQRVVALRGGRVVRVDFAWRDGAILMEADGYAKYLDADMRGGRSAEQVVLDEKLREEELREHCNEFVRCAWADAWAGAGLERKLVLAGVPRQARRGPLTF